MKRKYFLLSVFLISLVSCSGKNSFTNLKSYVNTNNDKKLENPIEIKYIKDDEFKKNENIENTFKNFKFVLEHLENNQEVKETKLKNEKTLEFNFEGKKYDIILETWEEIEKRNENKESIEQRNKPFIFIRKYDNENSKLYDISFKSSDGINVLKMTYILNDLINK